MIKELFLPEKIGARRILSQRIVGIAVHETEIRIAAVYAKGSKSYIEYLGTENIPNGPEDTTKDRTAQTIKKSLLHVSSYDQIRISIPASIVVFKELQMHFTDPEKIRMVLDFEVETMLPFPIHEAVIDFIITKSDVKNQTAQVLVAAVRTQDLQEHIDLYAKAGVDPANITIDLLALYGLMQQIPDYANLQNAVALVEFGEMATRVAFIHNGQLRMTRSIQRGSSTIIKLISDEAKIDIPKLIAHMADKGFNDGEEAINRIIQKHFVMLLNDLQFTLNSFSLKLNQYEGVTKVLLTGQTDIIKDFLPFCTDTLQIPCEALDCKKLLTLRSIKSKIKNQSIIWNNYNNALGIALPSIQQTDFDLRRKQFAFRHHGLIVKQITAGCILTLILFITIAITGYLDINKLSEYADRVEKNEIGHFKAESVFSKDRFPKKATLATVVREGEKAIKEKSEMWAPFAQQGMRPLELWLEVTRIIDKKQFDVSIREFSLSTKDSGNVNIEIDGLFKSKTGNHFVDFMPLSNRFKESSALKFIDIEETTAPEGGVNFSVKLKPKEI